jgi:hypothetical protein
MAAVLLNRPTIEVQSPEGSLRLTQTGNVLISENCQLTIMVTFSEGQDVNCALRVRIDRKFINYFTMLPDSADSNEYEIYRYYGRVQSGMIDTFDFRLKSDKTLEQIKAYASPVFIIITAYDCDYRDVKRVESVRWDIT